jgi:hypothetical protein
MPCGSPDLDLWLPASFDVETNEIEIETKIHQPEWFHLYNIII